MEGDLRALGALPVSCALPVRSRAAALTWPGIGAPGTASRRRTRRRGSPSRQPRAGAAARRAGRAGAPCSPGRRPPCPPPSRAQGRGPGGLGCLPRGGRPAPSRPALPFSAPETPPCPSLAPRRLPALQFPLRPAWAARSCRTIEGCAAGPGRRECRSQRPELPVSFRHYPLPGDSGHPAAALPPAPNPRKPRAQGCTGRLPRTVQGKRAPSMGCRARGDAATASASDFRRLEAGGTAPLGGTLKTCRCCPGTLGSSRMLA